MIERGWTIQERFYVTKSERIAIGAWYGSKKMAPLAQVRRFVRANGTNGIEQAVNAYADLEDAGIAPVSPVPDPYQQDGYVGPPVVQ